MTGAGPITGLMVLGSALIVTTAPGADVAPRLRTAIFGVALLVFVVSAVAILENLFAESVGGVRLFFRRFPTIMRFPLPTALLAGTGAWLVRRVAPPRGV